MRILLTNDDGIYAPGDTPEARLSKLSSELLSELGKKTVAFRPNYDGTRTEPAPINAFHKSPNSIIGHGDTMVLPDVPAVACFDRHALGSVYAPHGALPIPAAQNRTLHLCSETVTLRNRMC